MVACYEDKDTQNEMMKKWNDERIVCGMDEGYVYMELLLRELFVGWTRVTSIWSYYWENCLWDGRGLRLYGVTTERIVCGMDEGYVYMELLLRYISRDVVGILYPGVYSVIQYISSLDSVSLSSYVSSVHFWCIWKAWFSFTFLLVFVSTETKNYAFVSA